MRFLEKSAQKCPMRFLEKSAQKCPMRFLEKSAQKCPMRFLEKRAQKRSTHLQAALPRHDHRSFKEPKNVQRIYKRLCRDTIIDHVKACEHLLYVYKTVKINTKLLSLR